ncbi:MAG: sugar kinase [Cellulomonadaceae bacterium]|nr:sugar kinase [Cellulomonadaceae bacterium]
MHVGNAVVDHVLRIPQLPVRGGDVVATGSFDAVGGGFNVMAAAARDGLAVVYGGMHGTGPRGDLVRAALAAEGVVAAQPPLEGLDTGEVLTLVDAGSERTFVTVPGAESHLDATALARLDPQPGDLVYVTGYSLAHRLPCAALASWVPRLSSSVVVVLDPGPLVGQLPHAALEAVLARADWCTLNASEARAMTGCVEPEAAARSLLAQLHPGACVVVRLGADGCLVVGASVDHVPGMPVEAVDLNGAGDAHTGVLMATLARGLGPVEAARRANGAAALAVTRRGPATSPRSDELDAALDGWRDLG